MMNHEQIVDALNSLVPDAKWQLTGDDYSNIVWIEGNQPTIEEIEAEIIALPAKKEAAKAEATAARQVLLDKLGITAEEAKLLLS